MSPIPVEAPYVSAQGLPVLEHRLTPSVSRQRTLVTTVLVVVSANAAGAWAAEPAREPEDVTGVMREEKEPSDVARHIGSGVLFLPRTATELLFTATGTAAGLIDEEQVVPRIDDLLHPDRGAIHVFPTAFVETGSSTNVGVRAIGRAGNTATTVRVGYGSTHDVVAESRLRLAFPRPLPTVLAFEAFHDERSSIGYLGLGQDPQSEPRNRFLPTAMTRAAVYSESRERFIASFGARAISDLELFVSSSYARRHVYDPPEPDAAKMTDVFEPDSVPGYQRVNRVVYSEVAVRLDTRVRRGGPATGFLFETYAGHGQGVGTPVVQYLRAGGRVAGFISVVEHDNVLSPKLVLDGVSPNRGDLPFIELPRQSDFRGFDNRRDYVSAVGSLDYRWTLARYLAARLFGDVATVAPAVRSLELEGLRWDAGFGLDVFSRDSQLGSVAFSGSPEGLRFILRFGVSGTFGDRQHRG